MYEKVFVEVIVKYKNDREIVPLKVSWADGREFEVDKVMDIRQAASLKVGGQGMRFTCRIMNRETYLWLESGKWFAEAKE